jgi:DNA-binding HxlR family transcriptional regulator
MKNDTMVDNQVFAEKKNLIYTEARCPVRATMKIIGGKWKLVLIHIINNESPARFGELKRKAEGITQTMLTSVLRELEEDSVLHRKIYAEIPPKVEYTLTDLGRSLLPMVSFMVEWGKEHKLEK